jgi:hypothetical protein
VFVPDVVHVAVSINPGCVIASPATPASLRASTWLLLKINKLPPRVTNDPKVPPQQVIAPALFTKSFALLPVVPNSTGKLCEFALSGNIVTVELPFTAVSACDTAITVTVVGFVSIVVLSNFVGTALGATYNPLLEMNPSFLLPPAVPLTSQVTAVLLVPFTVAVNFCVLKSETETVTGVTVT